MKSLLCFFVLADTSFPFEGNTPTQVPLIISIKTGVKIRVGQVVVRVAVRV